MKDSKHWKGGSSKWLKCLTNWEKDKKDKKMLYWSDRGEDMTLNSILHVSDELKNIMSLKE